MSCQKAACRDDEVFGQALCAGHLKEYSADEQLRPYKRAVERLGRELQIFNAALNGPAANTEACIKKLHELMVAENELRETQREWFARSEGGLPS